MSEIWKTVTDFEGLYEVSSLGRVRKMMKDGNHLIRKLNEDRKGYLWIYLSKDNKRKYYKIHRLVAAEFIGKSKQLIHHINEDKKDNRPENLEYVSDRENSNHYRRRFGKYMTGVFRYKEGRKFYSRAFINGVKTYLGAFDTEIEAHQAYLSKIGPETKYMKPTGDV
jgi:hypothetical protein